MDTGNNNILIAGGTGLIGKALKKEFESDNWNVSILSRSRQPDNPNVFHWDPETNLIDSNALRNNKVIINLAGTGIADKFWTEKRKQEIISSRVGSINTLANAIAKSDIKPKHIIQASATGFYGNRPSERLLENSKEGEGYLAEVCQQWESATKSFNNLGVPVTVIRIGVVLSNKGGFLPRILAPSKSRVNIIPGHGQQILPWVHISDLTRLFLFCAQEKVHGAINGVSPESNSLEDVQKAVSSEFIGKTIPVKTGTWIIKSLLGQFSELFLNSQDIGTDKLLDAGFKFHYGNLYNCMAHLKKNPEY